MPENLARQLGHTAWYATNPSSWVFIGLFQRTCLPHLGELLSRSFLFPIVSGSLNKLFLALESNHPSQVCITGVFTTSLAGLMSKNISTYRGGLSLKTHTTPPIFWQSPQKIQRVTMSLLISYQANNV